MCLAVSFKLSSFDFFDNPRFHFNFAQRFKIYLGIQIFFNYYSVLHQFRQAKFANGGLILSLSQSSILPQLPQKIKLASKVVKINP
jgi:hypothetical protein